VLALVAALAAMCGGAQARTPHCTTDWEEDVNEYSELVMEPPTDDERRQVYAAVERCRIRTRPHLVNHWDVLALVRIEDRLLIPRMGRGILPAIWCIEASMMTRHKGGPILGDYREGRGYISQGPFQLSELLAARCGGTPEHRHDLLWSARCWVSHVHRVHARTQTACPKRSWFVAEAIIANPRKYGGDCSASSKHYQLLGL
jgi:hypothetical protein